MAAVRFMRTQGFDRVVMIGTSIGAVSCLLAAHHLKQAVVGVVAENPFTTIQANVDGLVHKIAFQRVLLRQNKPLMWLCSPVRRTVARLTIWRIMRLLGPNATRRDVHAINIMAGLAPRPVLLMHGTEDRLIDHQHTVELAEQVGGLHAVVLLTLRLHGLPMSHVCVCLVWLCVAVYVGVRRPHGRVAGRRGGSHCVVRQVPRGIPYTRAAAAGASRQVRSTA